MIEGHVGWIERDTKRIVQVNLGWAYAAVGRNDDALAVLREAAVDDDVSAMNNLGSVLGRVGKWEEAEQVLERARRRDPDDPNVQSNLGWVYANVGRLDEAAALLERAHPAAAERALGARQPRMGAPAGRRRSRGAACARDGAHAAARQPVGGEHDGGRLCPTRRLGRADRVLRARPHARAGLRSSRATTWRGPWRPEGSAPDRRVVRVLPLY